MKIKKKSKYKKNNFAMFFILILNKLFKSKIIVIRLNLKKNIFTTFYLIFKLFFI